MHFHFRQEMKIKVSMRSSPHRATVHRTVAFDGSSLAIGSKRKGMSMAGYPAPSGETRCLSALRKVRCRCGRARIEQQSTGLLHLMVRVSPSDQKEKG